MWPMTSSTRSARRRALQAVSARPRVVAAYLRLSEDRDGNKIGYDVQRKAIERWARANDYEVAWYKDPDITAGKIEKKRPDFERMLKAVAEGKYVGVVVWRLDRLVRLSREFERAFGIVEDAHCFIQDVEQGLNTGTEMGRMVVRILVMVAEMELAAMRARARAHQAQKAEDGKLSAGGFRPFGFEGVQRDESNNIVNRDRALIAHHPVEAGLIREAYDKILKRGASFADVTRDWEARGFRGTNGNWMGIDAVIQILTRPRIAGLREYEIADEETGEIRVDYSKAVWEPIVSRDDWERVRGLIKSRGARSSVQSYLLNDGLIVCGNCGWPLIGCATKGSDGEKRGNYRCNTSLSARKRGACGSGIVRSDFVEDLVVELTLARYEQSPELLDLLRAEHDESKTNTIAEARTELIRVEQELEEMSRRYMLPAGHPDGLEKVEWEILRGGLRARKAEAAKVLEDISGGLSFPLPSESELSDLPAWFDALDHGQQRSFLRANLEEVRVMPRRSASRAWDPDRIVPIFAGAKDAGGVGK